MAVGEWRRYFQNSALVIVHLIDGTYELFRHFYGLRRFHKTDPPFGAVAGVLGMIAKMIEDGATHIGVATDHIIESFRNELWPGYKTGAGIDRALWAQFHPLEDALAAMAVVVWPMVEFEADDALAAAAHLAARDKKVEKVCIWTPDKDLSQCVVGDRVVQIDRRKNEIRNAEGVRAKFGVAPEFIADYLALVGDSADGYPGLPGFGPKTVAKLINQHGHIEDFPASLLSDTNRELALLFKDLATLRVDAPLDSPTNGRTTTLKKMHWSGAGEGFASVAQKINSPGLATRVDKLSHRSS
jgi:5'-3' exonuclease